ncbi:tRNA dihydrouridine synthase DusB [Alcaligenes endophyticus]|uniref:tRNA-dihydrouridine synthase B n=1 Tax=Alcaligenes endophyticus TaxID=1929088 RepID=A0ABT8EHJ2_9BURK|nr:tRNA dihydrouridine synthase DusB [Alcaligenes endophyticus]MCX5589731.1 tRNA dihydrouridine synthase DusB [Alcaligenes endophyticus]MDN4120605.1 tRNA dihydrouridine synthase DusB [Alcaligenes endophyticus]
MRLGSWTLPNTVFIAPMAGVTDRPYRRLCKSLGAGYAVSEMAASNPRLWDSVKTSRRLNHEGEIDPIAVQIAGSDPDMMAEAAVFNIQKGARIIDINMGCPAKKVCNVLSGSALLKDEDLIARLLESVVKACTPHQVPVTLKTRTGWDPESRNAVRVAKLAESIGIAALTLHGRTRCDFYQGHAEYDTLREVKQHISIPLIANGDIDSPEKAKFVLEYTQADAIMVGRAAQGRPWIFREIQHYLEHGSHRAPPSFGELRHCMLEHLEDHYSFYGEYTGVRTARKHIGWYLADMPNANHWLKHINQINSTREQLQALEQWFDLCPADAPYIQGQT